MTYADLRVGDILSSNVRPWVTVTILEKTDDDALVRWQEGWSCRLSAKAITRGFVPVAQPEKTP